MLDEIRIDLAASMQVRLCISLDARLCAKDARVRRELLHPAMPTRPSSGRQCNHDQGSPCILAGRFVACHGLRPSPTPKAHARPSPSLLLELVHTVPYAPAAVPASQSVHPPQSAPPAAAGGTCPAASTIHVFCLMPDASCHRVLPLPTVRPTAAPGGTCPAAAGRRARGRPHGPAGAAQELKQVLHGMAAPSSW